jgi:Na+-transporting NADH:ubiquinone oxidoreductase subunit C
MKTIYLALLILATLFWGCKQKVTAEPQPKATERATEAPAKAPMSSIIKELGQFADIDLPDMTVVDEMIHFKKINGNGDIETIDSDSYLALYQNTVKNGNVSELPIFEIRNSDNAILMMGGKGFGGPIWAKVLVDRKARTLTNIEFDHRSESDGYGAGISEAGFAKQFVDAKINVKANTFGLDQTGKKIISGTQMVDGLSGATATSGAAVNMVNNGLIKYAGYLNRME